MAWNYANTADSWHHASRSQRKNSSMVRPLSKSEIETIFARLKAREPEPKTELIYSNAFTLLVAVVLSAQATDKGVNRATKDLFAIADTPDKMLALGEKRLADFIKTIGLYRTKTKN